MVKEDDDLKSIPVIAVTVFAMKGDEQKIREGKIIFQNPFRS